MGDGMKRLRIGLDVGSTTAKLVVMQRDIIIYQDYVRHFSDIKRRRSPCSQRFSRGSPAVKQRSP